MPYSSVDDLPEGVKGLPTHAKRIYLGAFNAAYGEYKSDEHASKIAWGAVKKAYKKNEKGEWEKKAEVSSFLIQSPEFEVKFVPETGEYFVEGYLLTYNPDKERDIFTKECMEDIKNQVLGQTVNIVVGREHEHVLSSPNIVPSGKIIDAHLDDRGLIAKTKLNKHEPNFDKTWGSITDGFLNAYSIEFRALDFTGTKGMNRKINRAQIGGATFTGKPMQPNAKLTDWYIKSMALFESIDDDTATNIEVKPMVEETKPAEVKAEPVKVEQPAVATEVKSAEQPKVEVALEPKVDEIKSLVDKVTALENEIKSIKALNEKKNIADVVVKDVIDEVKAAVSKEKPVAKSAEEVKAFSGSIYDELYRQIKGVRK